jgi:ribose-phosphate pyrophosphokinase
VTAALIHALSSAAGDAKRLGDSLGIATHDIAVHGFPDGELRVTVAAASPVAIVYAPLDRPNDKLITILFAAEALRRNGARRVILVAPYLCYMRQDAAFRAGEAISQRVIGRLLADAFDRIVTVDAHLHRTRDIRKVFPGAEADDLSAVPAIAAALRKSGLDPATIVVGPDSESRAWVGHLAAELGLAATVADKRRHDDLSVDITFADTAKLAERPALLLDDIVSSGGTLIACANALGAAGARSVDAIVTHALFPMDLMPSFKAAGIRSLRSTHSVPHPTNAIPLDDILAEALRGELVDRVAGDMP